MVLLYNTCSRVELRKVGYMYTQVSTIIFSSKCDWSVGAYKLHRFILVTEDFNGQTGGQTG